MRALDELPLGYTKFSEFINLSLIYVDKTDLIAKLTRSKGPIFLSRPRRFGKSTFRIKLIKLFILIFRILRKIEDFFLLKINFKIL